MDREECASAPLSQGFDDVAIYSLASHTQSYKHVMGTVKWWKKS